jgi:ATP-binding cassette subfamily C protein
MWTVATTHRAAFAAMMTLFAAATVAGLIGPALLGGLVESVGQGMTSTRVDAVALVFVVVLLVQALLQRWARFVAAVFGERLLAEAREGLVGHVVGLPLDVVESAGTGELLSRATSDVDKLDEGLRQAAPQIVIASVNVALTAVAMVLASPLLALGMLLAVPVLVISTRWYRPRAVPNYERVLARWAGVHASTYETVDGGRTVEALGLADRRIAHHDAALRRVVESEYRTGRLWATYLVWLEAAALLPIAALLLLGGWAYGRGLVGIGEITAIVLYARTLAEPLNEVLGWMDELQIGNAALRRILGVRELVIDTGAVSAAGATPHGRHLTVRDVRFGYHQSREVLHGVDLDIAPGERLAVVGPSGAGKSTLGRLLAGVNTPESGSVTIGGVSVSSLPLARRRKEVVLVTQEQHVFAGTLRENLTLPRSASDDELWDALRAVGASAWAKALPAGLDAEVGPGASMVPLAIVQQLALARLVLADPHTLVLDEATSLVDSSAARELERSLAAVLAGRTVVAIAHRLDAARDADRVAVMMDGRIVELGTHDELVAAGGSYSELWAAWSGDGGQHAAERRDAGAPLPGGFRTEQRTRQRHLSILDAGDLHRTTEAE